MAFIMTPEALSFLSVLLRLVRLCICDLTYISVLLVAVDLLSLYFYFY